MQYPSNIKFVLSILRSKSGVCSLSIFFLMLWLIPFLILGENSYFNIHDNLDSNVTWYKLLNDVGAIFDLSGQTVIPYAMGGLPKDIYLSSTLNVVVVLYSFLEPHYAYIVNYFLVHLIGFTGTYLLLKTYVLPGRTELHLAALLAFCFASICYYSTTGISVSGQPLLLFAFLNILNRKFKWYDFAIVIIFPFYAFLVFTLPFFLPILLGFLYYDWQRTRKINGAFVGAVVLLVVIFATVEFQLVQTMILNKQFVSHRTVWSGTERDLSYIVKATLNTFIFGQEHIGRTISFIPYLLSVGIALYAWLKYRKAEREIVLLLLIILAVCFLTELSDNIRVWFGGILPILKSFSFNRFFFSLPTLQILLFAFAVKRLLHFRLMGKMTIAAILLAQIFINVVLDVELRKNLTQIAGFKINQPTYKQFYAEELFEQINKSIGLPKKDYKVVSLGIFPSVAQFNKFYTLDSYQPTYPLAYKLQFRKVIEKELEKNEELRQYFDEYGSRCYLFSDELGRNYMVTEKTIKNLEINTEQLKNMGGDYIFSAAQILNYQENNLNLVGEFNSDFWTIYVYKIQ